MNEQDPNIMIQVGLVELAFQIVGLFLNLFFVLFESLLTEVYTSFFDFFRNLAM